MATRVQAQYTPEGTGLQRPSAVQRLTELPQQPRVSSAQKLAEALASLNPGRITADLTRIQEIEDAEEKRKAQEFANSVSVDELGKMIREGRVLPSQSPVFQATVQHIYADNYRNSLERETLAGITSGSLRFGSAQELEGYLTSKRNEFLEGQSEYAVAGFDRGWNSFREKALNTNLQVTNKEAVERAVMEATDSLNNELLAVTSDTFAGTTDDAATLLMKRYELLSATHVLTPAARKEAMDGLALRIAASGRRDLLETLLRKKTPNNGPTVEALLGNRAVSLRNAADTQYARALKEQERLANIMAAEALIQGASMQADTLLATGRGYQIPSLTVPTPDGGTKVIKADDIKLDAINRRIAQDPDMSFTDQIRLYAQADVENKAWANDFNAAVNNIAEVSLDARGKPLGELLPATVEALDRFSVINQTNAYYARRLAGTDDKYQMLSNIQALRESGVPETGLAASLVYQAHQNTAKNMDSIKAQVQKAVNSLTDASIFSGRFWSEVFEGEWGEGDKNVRPMAGAISSLAESYMAANIVTSGEAAVELALKYYSDPAVTTQINNTIYLNKDLPRVPEGDSQRFWFQRYLDEEVADYLKSEGIKYDADEVYLHPMRGGEGTFMLHLNGTPLGKYFTRREIESWIDAKYAQDVQDAIRETDTKSPEDAFLRSETEGGGTILYRNPRR